ncbi:hypothetical protein [Aquabacterium sp.]|uniref:hypothetical protein n=1 Tax=Aquabacterium sp. TaxID=1872578 RepID=UPI004038376B
MATPEKTQQVAFKALDALQGDKAGDQVAAVSMMFLLVCQRHRLKPRDVLDKGARILQDSLSQGRGEYVRAIRDYLQDEHP